MIQILWWCAHGLLALLLAFAVKGRFLTKYPFFYAYVSFRLVVGLLRFFIFTFQSNDYLIFYWSTQFLIAAGGYTVLWEISAQVLNDYPGTAKVSRVLVRTVLVVILTDLCAITLTGQTIKLSKSVIGLERNIHSVEAVLMVLLIMIIRYYGIPLGKNVWGLMLGYGFLIATSLITLTLRSFLGLQFQLWWQYLDQIWLVTTLAFWSLALHSYQPNPKPKPEIGLERDYLLLAEWTSQAITKARGNLRKAFLS